MFPVVAFEDENFITKYLKFWNFAKDVFPAEDKRGIIYGNVNYFAKMTNSKKQIS
jgi:hypothetical protein